MYTSQRATMLHMYSVNTGYFKVILGSFSVFQIFKNLVSRKRQVLQWKIHLDLCVIQFMWSLSSILSSRAPSPCASCRDVLDNFRCSIRPDKTQKDRILAVDPCSGRRQWFGHTTINPWTRAITLNNDTVPITKLQHFQNCVWGKTPTSGARRASGHFALLSDRRFASTRFTFVSFLYFRNSIR